MTRRLLSMAVWRKLRYNLGKVVVEGEDFLRRFGKLPDDDNEYYNSWTTTRYFSPTANTSTYVGVASTSGTHDDSAASTSVHATAASTTSASTSDVSSASTYNTTRWLTTRHSSITPASTSNDSAASTSNATASDKSASAHSSCPVCLNDKQCVAVVPCGHVFCNDCVTQVQKCPMCRRWIVDYLKLYF